MPTHRRTPRDSGEPGRLWPFLLLLGIVALAIDFGTVHAWHTADSVIFPLASLYAWTPFFWDQDRVGLLVPLLCSPIRNPWTNLQVQVGLTAFMGLCVPLLAAEYITKGSRAGRWAAVLSLAVLLAVGPRLVLSNLLFECCYPTGLVLGLAGLVVLDAPGPGRWQKIPLAFVLLVLAHWVYLGIPVVLGPLIVLRAFVSGPRGNLRARLLRPLRDPPARTALVLLGLAIGIGFELMARFASDSPDYQPLPSDRLGVRAWPGTWATFAQRFLGEYGGETWCLVVAGLAILGIALARGRGGWAIVAIPLIVALTEFLFTGTREWPAQNEHHPRYLLAAVLFGGLAATLPLARILWQGRHPRAASVVAVVALFAATLRQFGLPSPSAARTGLDFALGTHTEAFLATHADAIGGRFWTVWPTTFHANVVRYERGDPGPVIGIAMRSWAWKNVWQREHPAGFRVAVLANDAEFAEARHYSIRFGLCEPERRGTVGPFNIWWVHGAK